MVNIERHEFWLTDYLIRGRDNIFSPVYRVVLGELINAEDRKTFRPHEKSHDRGTKSGSIGFMDLTTIEELVPKECARLYPNPYENPDFEHRYLDEDHECARALTILTIGIEPEYRGRNYASYARLLKQRAEELALEWGLDTIVVDRIENPKIEKAIVRLGYTLYNYDARRAVKRLKTQSQ